MEDFIKRLTHLLEHFKHTASSFSDTIGIQRSSLSHLLSGRNKPSLDFILKIQENFPDVNLYWLLKGEEPFLLQEEKSSSFPIEKIEKEELYTTPITEDEIEKEAPSLPLITPSKQEFVSDTRSVPQKSVERIIFFYTDGSFKEYQPEP